MAEVAEPGADVGVEQPRERLSLLATLGLTSVLLGVGFVSSVVVGVGYTVYLMLVERRPRDELAEIMSSDGFGIALGAVLSAPVTIAALLLVVRFGHVSGKSALALRSVRLTTLGLWAAIGIASSFGLNSIYHLLGLDFGEQVVAAQYCTARSTVLFAGAMIACAPLVEELVIRGFMFSGLSESRLGPLGAAVVASLVWTVLHVQYQLYVLLGLFILGVVLGVSRWVTKSIYPALMMHMIWNGVAILGIRALVETPEGSCDSRSGVRIVTALENEKLFPKRWASDQPQATPLAETDRIAAFEAVQSELRLYPKAPLRSGLRAVFVTRTLSFNGREQDSARGLETIYLTLDDHHSLSTLKRRFHFQLAGILFHKHRKRFPEASWRSQNPIGFTYADEGRSKDESYATNESFVRSLGSKSLVKDIQTVAEVLFAGSIEEIEWAANTPRLRAKAVLLDRFYGDLGIETPVGPVFRLLPREDEPN